MNFFLSIVLGDIDLILVHYLCVKRSAQMYHYFMWLPKIVISNANKTRQHWNRWDKNPKRFEAVDFWWQPINMPEMEIVDGKNKRNSKVNLSCSSMTYVGIQDATWHSLHTRYLSVLLRYGFFSALLGNSCGIPESKGFETIKR